MIGEIIDILEAESSVMSYLNNDATNIHAIQRRQETPIPCLVVCQWLSEMNWTNMLGLSMGSH